MSLPQRKRTVHFYEIRMHSTTRAAVSNPACAPLPDLLVCFAKMATQSKLPQTIRKSTHLHTVLADWHFDQANGCYALLISKANAALSDVALRDLGTQNLRKAGKTKAEGIELSAHVLLRPNQDGRTALALLTMGSGVIATDIEMLLRLLARQAAKDPNNKALFYFDDPSGARESDGKARQYKVRYGFAAFSHPGQTLDHALKTGEFEGFDLVANDESNFDAGGNLQITQRSITIAAKLPKNVTGATIRNAVRTFQKNPDSRVYDRLRIRYKTEAGQSTSATLKTNALDAAFTLKEHIEFDSDVEAQQDNLSPVILEKMMPLLQLVP